MEKVNYKWGDYFFLNLYYEKFSLENYSQKLESATFYDLLKRALEYEAITGKQMSLKKNKTPTQQRMQ